MIIAIGSELKKRDEKRIEIGLRVVQVVLVVARKNLAVRVEVILTLKTLRTRTQVKVEVIKLIPLLSRATK